MTATIILAHGSRRPETDETLRKLIEMVMKKIDNADNIKIVPAYLQLAEPLLGEVVDGLVKGGVKYIKIIPMFIFDGVHVTTDIPEEIEALKRKYNGIVFELKSHIGADPLLADILVHKILNG